jgi:hypothetical protein
LLRNQDQLLWKTVGFRARRRSFSAAFTPLVRLLVSPSNYLLDLYVLL